MRRPNPPSIITVAIITTITIIAWIFFDVYQILTKQADVDVPQQLLRPLNPTLNQEVLFGLKERVDFQKDSVTHFSSNIKIDENIETAEEIAVAEEAENEEPEEGFVATVSGELSE